MQAKVIMNPWANHGRALAIKEELHDLASVYGDVDIVLTDHIGHAISLAAAAVDDGYDLVIAAGGDGTVHEIANGMVVNGNCDACLGVIPLGSGNDFAHGLGLPADLQQSVLTIFEGRPNRLDLAMVVDDRGREKLGINGIGIGFDAAVTIAASKITRVHGFAMYGLATLRTIAQYYEMPHMEIHFDDQYVEQDALMISIGLAPRIGGGFYLTPNATPFDNLLDSCLANPIGRLTMLLMLPRLMKGTHVTSRHVTMRQSRNIKVKSDIPLPIHIDGEIFAYHQDHVQEVKIETLPAALPLMC